MRTIVEVSGWRLIQACYRTIPGIVERIQDQGILVLTAELYNKVKDNYWKDYHDKDDRARLIDRSRWWASFVRYWETQEGPPALWDAKDWHHTKTWMVHVIFEPQQSIECHLKPNEMSSILTSVFHNPSLIEVGLRTMPGKATASLVVFKVFQSRNHIGIDRQWSVVKDLKSELINVSSSFMAALTKNQSWYCSPSLILSIRPHRTIMLRAPRNLSPPGTRSPLMPTSQTKINLISID